MCQMQCRMTHNTAATASKSRQCQQNCSFVHMPLDIRVDRAFCHGRVNNKFYQKADREARGHAHKKCGLMAELAYERGTMNYPHWLLNYKACIENMTFTGSSPAAREGKLSCGRMPRGSHAERVERNKCYRQCYNAIPAAARVYKMECEDDLRFSVPEEKSRHEQRLYLAGVDVCWVSASERIITENKTSVDPKSTAGACGGNGSSNVDNGDVSNAAFSSVATKLGMKMETIRADVTARLDRQISDTRNALVGLMHAQWATEEFARQSGGSGITKSRVYRGGTKSYHTGSYAAPAMANAHNHANGRRTVGLGEFSAVMNGVNFRTRHNDYSLRKPSTTSSTYHKTEDIQRPPVPPSVLEKETIDEQIVEMRQYFKAFKEQNSAHRNYTPYFKPILCYLEGAWEKLEGHELVEPFESDRHHIAATDWEDLVEKARFFDLSGGKDQLENIPYLPTSVNGMDIKDGRLEPQLARWSYRILCHPIDGDVELARLHLVEDYHVKIRSTQSREQFFNSRAARFRVDPRLSLADVKRDPYREVSMGRNYLDLLMEQIPGKDNYVGKITDEVMNPNTEQVDLSQTALGKQREDGPLNSAYYSRYWLGGDDAMGRRHYKRGYNDPTFWAAMSSHERLANVSMIKSDSRLAIGQVCELDGEPCPRINQRWTYAFPLEIIYLTPLHEWNPHGINTLESRNDVMTGDGTKDSPFSHAREADMFYRTPAGFYGSCGADIEEEPVDTADTDKAAMQVQDSANVSQAVVASGTSITTKCIPGVGNVRLRYNIMPTHEEGNTVWKEVEALHTFIDQKDLLGFVAEPKDASMISIGTVTLLLTGPKSMDHDHEVVLDGDMLRDLQDGREVWVTSTPGSGHQHALQISATESEQDESDHGLDFHIDVCITGTVAKNHACEDGLDSLEYVLSTEL